MIEGQEDVTWEDWVGLADTCERSGIEALFRSDHYLSVWGRESGRARTPGARSTRSRPARRRSARHDGLADLLPAPLGVAKLVTTADHVSNGRIELGMGTGWSEVEHTAMGFDFRSMKERMDVLEEQLTIVHDGHFKDGPFSFKGSHYTIEDLTSRPLPIQRPHPPLILGGNAGPRAARLAAGSPTSTTP